MGSSGPVSHLPTDWTIGWNISTFHMLTLQDIIHLPHQWEVLASTGLYEADFYIPICQSQLRNCLSSYFRKRDCETGEAALRIMATSQAFFKMHSCALPQLACEIAAQYSLNLQWMSCSDRVAEKTCCGESSLSFAGNLKLRQLSTHSLSFGLESWSFLVTKVVMMVPQGNVGCRSWSTSVGVSRLGKNLERWWWPPDSDI